MRLKHSRPPKQGVADGKKGKGRHVGSLVDDVEEGPTAEILTHEGIDRTTPATDQVVENFPAFQNHELGRVEKPFLDLDTGKIDAEMNDEDI